MPSKYRIRDYQKNSLYHVYNKGFGKSNIFLDDEDYQKFFYYLEAYLNPLSAESTLPKRLLDKNLNQEVETIGYLLLPDHFHLIIKQKTKTGVSKLLKQLINGYTYYFNKKYKNSGGVFDGKFKSIKIGAEDLLPLIHFLHTHPQIDWLAGDIKNYAWSSHRAYLENKSGILSKDYILSLFQNPKDYEGFINKKSDFPKNTFCTNHRAQN